MRIASLVVPMSIFLLILSWQAVVSCGLPQAAQEERERGVTHDDVDPGKPLFLTPYLERGDIAEARRLARVTLDQSLQIESYSGFFTVNKAYDSNQFFWYFPSMSPDKDSAPLVLWLQGGPGGTSLFGLFVENGPIAVVNKQFQRRQYHWALNHHVIYIDNPVGAGFSFTNSSEGYCTDETQVGEQLYSAMSQFFQLFPELQQNKFFITGESYAGKYVPALAHTILKKSAAATVKMDLQGLIIGGAWINPDSQQHYRSDGFMSLKTAKKLNSIQKFSHNLLTDLSQDPDSDFISTLTKNSVRKAIHVGKLSFDFLSVPVWNHLGQDISRSMAPWLAEILDHYPVILYGGDKDNTVAYAGIVDFLQNHFNFTGEEEYKAARRYAWRVDGALAGCVRGARGLADLLVLDATHYVPKDQPRRALDMLTRITHGKGFDQKETCPIQ